MWGERVHVEDESQVCGPSPRVWGEPPERRYGDGQTRTIPTRVGRTARKQSVRRLRTDHPHACGENGWDVDGDYTLDGPSPRVWGERFDCRRRHELHRTIPTRVGRTSPAVDGDRVRTDHPHACGENGASTHGPGDEPGPSPRVWGEQLLVNARRVRVRTIPTRVGRTSIGQRASN